MKPTWQETVKVPKLEMDLKKFGAAYEAGQPAINGFSDQATVPKIDHTYKLYYGGAQKRPDGNYVNVIRNVEGQPVAEVGQANRKDVRNAVEVATKAQPGWEKRSAFNKAQILFYIGENLELSRNEFASKLSNLTGVTLDEAEAE